MDQPLFPFDELRDTFEYLRTQETDGIPGVIRVTSAVDPSPNVIVSVMTHGNEPSGLAAVRHFLKDNLLQRGMIRGSVYFVLNNIDAASRYFTLPKNAPLADKAACRRLEVNMNRLPDDVRDLAGDTRSEIRRVHELLPLLDTMDAGIDIHSVSNDNVRMTIEVKGDGLAYAKRFPIETILTNIVQVQRGQPIGALYGGKRNIPVIGIEAGQHEHPDACRYAIECVNIFLGQAGIIADTETKTTVPTTEYRIAKSIVMPGPDWHLDRDFTSYEAVSADTVILRGPDNGTVVAGMAGHMLFAPPKAQPLNMDEEACFIAHPVSNG